MNGSPKRRLVPSVALFVLLIGALVWIGVALASGGSPVKGGLYEGMIGGPNSPADGLFR